MGIIYIKMNLHHNVMWQVPLDINDIAYLCFAEVNKSNDLHILKMTTYNKCTVLK